MAKINTLFMTKMAKTHTLWGHTYLYNPCEGVLLPGKLQVTSSLGICRAFDNFSCLRVVHLLHHASQVCPSDEVSSKVMLSFISGFQGRLLCCFSLVSEPVLNCCDMRKWLNYVTYKCWKYLFCLYNTDQPHVWHVLSVNRSHRNHRSCMLETLVDWYPWSTLNGNSIDICQPLNQC